MTKTTLLLAKDYINDVTQEIQKAKQRVCIVSLALSDDDLTHEFIVAVVDAAKRGVAVSIAVDTFTFSEFGGYFSLFKRWKARSRAAVVLANTFKEAGVTFRWLGGGYKFNPFAGVTHIKWCIVDDTVYCFGGVNLYQEGIEHTDYMLKLTDVHLAGELAEEQKEITKADMSFSRYDGFYKPLEFGTVYIDNGDRGNSIIYKRACELADEAKAVIFVSQYCPSGRLAEILKRKRASVYFNQPKNTSIYTRLFILMASFRYGLKSRYNRSNYLHAKFILFKMHDGTKIALTGSHNFSYTGVNFGTREVDLETSDQQTYAQLEDFFKKYVA